MPRETGSPSPDEVSKEQPVKEEKTTRRTFIRDSVAALAGAAVGGGAVKETLNAHAATEKQEINYESANEELRRIDIVLRGCINYLEQFASASGDKKDFAAGLFLAKFEDFRVTADDMRRMYDQSDWHKSDEAEQYFAEMLRVAKEVRGRSSEVFAYAEERFPDEIRSYNDRLATAPTGGPHGGMYGDGFRSRE